jgi:hypothetical protein
MKLSGVGDFIFDISSAMNLMSLIVIELFKLFILYRGGSLSF